jgi:hypothetical protein
VRGPGADTLSEEVPSAVRVSYQPVETRPTLGKDGSWSFCDGC